MTLVNQGSQEKRWIAVAFVTMAVVLVAGCTSDTPISSLPQAVALRLVEVPIPRVRAPGIDTRGRYPQVRSRHMNVRAVNAALRRLVRADQRAFTPFAFKERKYFEKRRDDVRLGRGLYWMIVDRKLASASTKVVSVLWPTTRDPILGYKYGDGWLSMTIRVPSGEPVAISELFADPSRGLRALGSAWKDEMRLSEAGRSCLGSYGDLYPGPNRANPDTYKYFALTPDGLAVGVPEFGHCYRLQGTVDYDSVRPYLSELGKELVAGVRRPR